MKPKVIVCVFNNLATDQRVEKVCSTLHNSGYSIKLVGCNWQGLPEIKRPYSCYRLNLKSKSLKTAYIEFNIKLYYFLKKNYNSKSIILANDLDLLYACSKFSKKHKLPLVYDSHEIFTELPYIQGRFVQKIWRYLEKSLIKDIRYMMTESDSYAQWFVKKYQIKKPLVIGNFPRYVNSVKKENNNLSNDKKIIIYQGVLNPFRGIDKAILAMKHLEDCVLWIIGDGTKRKFYEKLAQENQIENIVFFGNVLPAKLRTITPQADLGLSLEENAGLSYYYSLPNKVSDYIQARIPILGSDFPETGRAITTYKIGENIDNRNPCNIAKKIKIILGKPKDFYTENLEKASKELCWENQEKKIIQLFEKICVENNLVH